MQTAIEAVCEFTRIAELKFQDHLFGILIDRKKKFMRDGANKSYEGKLNKRNKSLKVCLITSKGLGRDLASILGKNLRLMKLALSQGWTKLLQQGLEIQEVVHLGRNQEVPHRHMA
jgi:hypothetical protein